jgi:hypothetical protein
VSIGPDDWQFYRGDWLRFFAKLASPIVSEKILSCLSKVEGTASVIESFDPMEFPQSCGL